MLSKKNRKKKQKKRKNRLKMISTISRSQMHLNLSTNLTLRMSPFKLKLMYKNQLKKDLKYNSI